MHAIAKRLTFSAVLTAIISAVGAAAAHGAMELQPSPAGDGGVFALGVDARPRVVQLDETTVDGVPKIRMRVDDAVRAAPGLPCAVTPEGASTLATCDRVGVAFRLYLGDGHDKLTTDPAMTFPVVARGGYGVDELTGGAGDDALGGDSGWDTIVGGAGRDTLYGGAGPDVLDARDGVADRLIDCTWEGGHRSQSLEEGGAEVDLVDPEPVDCDVTSRADVGERPGVWIRGAHLTRAGLVLRYGCREEPRCAGRVLVRARRGGRVLLRRPFRGDGDRRLRVTMPLGPRTRRRLRTSGGVVELVQTGTRAPRTTWVPVRPR